MSVCGKHIFILYQSVNSKYAPIQSMQKTGIEKPESHRSTRTPDADPGTTGPADLGSLCLFINDLYIVRSIMEVHT